MKKKINWILLILCFFVTYLTAFLGSIFTMQSVKTYWYALIKPTITPPNWVFPIVWNILFFMIGISLYLALTHTKNKSDRLKVGVVFAMNFILNALWNCLYFGLRNPFLALIEAFILYLSIILMILVSWRINKTSAWLLVPYSFWTGYAIILNYLTVFE
jgi:tryptophan-rich sensory protein